MNYLGHFTFYGKKEDEDGRFTMMAEAADPEEAADKFETEILRLREEDDVFDEVLEIYIDDIIEIERLPERAVVTRLEKTVPDGYTLSVNLLTEAEGLTVYGWVSDDQEEASEEEEQEMEPFVVFEQEEEEGGA
jgi:hypothetical protein